MTTDGALHYDHETYRQEISKALAHAKRMLKNCDFEDLLQDVTLEIWQATERYGDQMNARLAFRIAKNQAAAFLRERIKSQTILVTDAGGNLDLNESGLAKGLNGAELKRQSKDKNAAPEVRRKAKKHIEKYARKYPRFLFLDEKPEKDDEQEGAMTITFAEKKVSRILQERAGSDLSQTFRDVGGLLALRQLVGTWHGEKRRVGEAMLEPNFTVRSVPGLDKSKVSRIRQVVVKEFRAFITR
jgi:DNA-directed RNA polymerase specialized sigma24 family protein